MNIRVEVRNAQGARANFVAKEEDLFQAALDTVEEWRVKAIGVARNIVPVDTGRMRRSIRADYTGEVGKTVWVLYYDPAVFRKDGVVYYPIYVEYGTRKMDARPTLSTTMAMIEGPYRRSMTRAMRRAA